jgi:hypothetical protein
LQSEVQHSELSCFITKITGTEGLPDETAAINFVDSAGAGRMTIFEGAVV